MPRALTKPVARKYVKFSSHQKVKNMYQKHKVTPVYTRSQGPPIGVTSVKPPLETYFSTNKNQDTATEEHRKSLANAGAHFRTTSQYILAKTTQFMEPQSLTGTATTQPKTTSSDLQSGLLFRMHK